MPVSNNPHNRPTQTHLVTGAAVTGVTDVWCAPFRQPRVVLAVIAAHAVVAVGVVLAVSAVTDMNSTNTAGEWAPAAVSASSDHDVEGAAQ